MANNITRVFTGVDLRSQHLGLRALAAKHNIDLDKLNPGQHVLFFNSKLTKFKMYSAQGVLSYVSRDKRVDLEAIQYISQAFGVKGEFNFEKAERKMLEEKLAKQQRR